MPRASRNPAAAATAAAGGGLRKRGPSGEGRGRARSEILQAGKRRRLKEKVTLGRALRRRLGGDCSRRGAPADPPPNALRGADPGPPLGALGDEIIQPSCERRASDSGLGGRGSPGGVKLGSRGEGRR